MPYKYLEDTTYDFIWNITLICPWDCEFCCTDASYVKKESHKIVIFEKGLTKKTESSEASKESPMLKRIVADGFTPTIFDVALVDRQMRGKEISFDEKITAVNNLDAKNVKIDFAGGDPLSC